MTCPPFLFAGAAGILCGWSSGRLHERTWHITAGLGVAIVGFVIAASTLNTGGRYFACFVFPMGAYAVNSVIIGWASSTLGQTKEKKAVSLHCLPQSGPNTAVLTHAGCPCHDQRRWTDRLHLRRVSMAQVGLATVWNRLRCISWLRIVLSGVCLVDEDSVETGKCQDQVQCY